MCGEKRLDQFRMRLQIGCFHIVGMEEIIASFGDAFCDGNTAQRDASKIGIYLIVNNGKLGVQMVLNRLRLLSVDTEKG